MIEFDKLIYLKSALEQACKDYSQLAVIQLFESEKKYICKVEKPQGNLELIQDEFCNYVLNMTVMMGGTES